MDGTLTIPQHDFSEAYRRIGIPEDASILEYIDSLSDAEQHKANQILSDWECELAQQARAADDAIFLLEHLKKRGTRCAILTRNLEHLAYMTLNAAGLMPFFEGEPILGRDSAPPKPSPVPIQQILSSWGASPEEAVMVGDYIYDMQAGQAAGTYTLFKESTPVSSWIPHLQPLLTYDHRITSFTELME